MFFFDGEYIDKGVIEYRFMIEHTHWKPSRVNETALLLSLNDNVVISSAMNYQVIFLTKNVGTVNITEFSFMFSVGQTGSVDEDKLTADIKILSENLHTKITVEGK